MADHAAKSAKYQCNENNNDGGEKMKIV